MVQFFRANWQIDFLQDQCDKQIFVFKIKSLRYVPVWMNRQCSFWGIGIFISFKISVTNKSSFSKSYFQDMFHFEWTGSAVQFLRLLADSRSVWIKNDPVNFISIEINFSKFGQVQMFKWCSFLGHICRLISFKISVINKSLFSKSNL